MFERTRGRWGALALSATLCAGLVAAGPAGAAKVPGCGAYASQAQAQDAFIAAGGSPRRDVARMDGDRDGVACERLPGPYKGYATIGYNRKRQFLYGIVRMPQAPGGQAPCLYGDRIDPDSARKYNVFRVGSRGDRALLREYGRGTAANPESGQLLWRVDRPTLPSGRYYVVLEERIRTGPNARVECPGFSSRPTVLPRPRR